MSDMLRITGMVSGMDTDATVKKLIQAEQVKVDKAKQEKQYLEWQSEDYREVANLLRGFQDEYFDLLKPESNMRSVSSFNMFSGTATVGGVESSAVSIRALSNAVASTFTIDSVNQLATADMYESANEVFGNITSTSVDTIGNINTQIATDNSMSFSLDGETQVIGLSGSPYADYDELASVLTTKLQEAFTNVDIEVGVINGDQLEFKVLNKVSGLDEGGHVLSVVNDNPDLLGLIGLNAGQSNSVDLDTSLEDVFGITESQTMTINDVSFTFTKDSSVSDVMSEINSSSAGVTISYDSFTDKFTLKSNSVGTDSKIDITDTSGLLEQFKLQGAEMDYTEALNSEVVINGVTTTRASNTFEVNGAEITLNEIPAGALEVKMEADPSDAKDLIVKFVDAYNTMLEKVNELISTRKNYDFDPLTEAQKENMSDDDIEAWEAEARKGTLRNDSTLERIMTQLRTALYESVDGMGITLNDIGIESSTNYKDKGKLIIDETALDQALAEKPNEIIQLFTKESDVGYSDYDNRSERYSENGVAYRMFDILQDNIRLTRDSNGHKGYLIDKAGVSTTDATSELAMKLEAMDSKINDLLDLLADQEEKYYQQFSRMETAMARLNSQSGWILSQFGGGQ